MYRGMVSEGLAAVRGLRACLPMHSVGLQAWVHAHTVHDEPFPPLFARELISTVE
jgi:hypothetical protein